MSISGNWVSFTIDCIVNPNNRNPDHKGDRISLFHHHWMIEAGRRDQLPVPDYKIMNLVGFDGNQFMCLAFDSIKWEFDPEGTRLIYDREYHGLRGSTEDLNEFVEFCRLNRDKLKVELASYSPGKNSMYDGLYEHEHRPLRPSR